MTGRPRKKTPGSLRKQVLHVYLSPAELSTIHKAAITIGMDTSAYSRNLLLHNAYNRLHRNKKNPYPGQQ